MPRAIPISNAKKRSNTFIYMKNNIKWRLKRIIYLNLKIHYFRYSIPVAFHYIHERIMFWTKSIPHEIASNNSENTRQKKERKKKSAESILWSVHHMFKILVLEVEGSEKSNGKIIQIFIRSQCIYDPCKFNFNIYVCSQRDRYFSVQQ